MRIDKNLPAPKIIASISLFAVLLTVMKKMPCSRYSDGFTSAVSCLNTGLAILVALGTTIAFMYLWHSLMDAIAKR